MSHFTTYPNSEIMRMQNGLLNNGIGESRKETVRSERYDGYG
jgi:hypothetical protein